MDTVTNILNSTPQVQVVDAADQGFSGLTSDDFMRLLIVQLQNQDPTNPMESDQLLAQVSDMRNLQASIQLETALEGLTLGQQLSSSASFLGKTITGTVGDDPISGEVTAVQVRDGQAYLRVNGQDVAMKDIESVEP